MKLQFPIAFKDNKFSVRRSKSRSLEDAQQILGNATPFPPELWLEIFPLLPVSSVVSVALSCKFLGRLAQPFVFQRVSFRPCLHNKRTIDRYMERLSHRLNFLSSPHIARNVKECSLSLRTELGGIKTTFDDAVDAICDALSLFPNLEKVSFDGVQFTAQRLSALRATPSTILELKSCAIIDDNPLTGVKSLVCCDDLATQLLGQAANQPLSSFLDPIHLQHINVGPANTKDILSAIALSPKAFNALTSLELPVDAMNSEDIIPALEKCPNVRHLALAYYKVNVGRVVRDIPLSILPKLTSFDGPHQYATRFAQGRSLQDVILRPFSNTSIFCKPDAVCSTLIQLGPNIRILDITAVTDINTVLPVLRASFPLLTSLTINANPELYPRCFIPKDLIKTIQTVGLPSTLEHFSLGVHFKGTKSRISHDLASISEAAKAVCDRLTDVKAWYWTHPRPTWVTCDCSSMSGTARPRVSFDGR
ncbi:hypothetical protein BDZ94DRAFT_1258869 [Collybia nuda]|uniref:F-box domain-containing protein n=1 Tax=Collybia nuda TaxID=64659 RepID=A0A9P6CEY0_9AGAR|nr:hypothetical protein BDZ94DRAFT_1258869 [Collybia nuda]